MILKSLESVHYSLGLWQLHLDLIVMVDPVVFIFHWIKSAGIVYSTTRTFN